LYAKKFKVGGVTRDKEYPLFKTHSKSRIFFFAVHDNEKKNSNILVHLDPELKRVKEMVIEFDFAWIDLQGRGAKGSTLTSHKVDRVVNAPRDTNEDEEPKEMPGESSNKKSVEKAVKPNESSPPKEQQKTDSKDEAKSSDKKDDPKSQTTFEF